MIQATLTVYNCFTDSTRIFSIHLYVKGPSVTKGSSKNGKETHRIMQTLQDLTMKKLLLDIWQHQQPPRSSLTSKIYFIKSISGNTGRAGHCTITGLIHTFDRLLVNLMCILGLCSQVLDTERTFRQTTMFYGAINHHHKYSTAQTKIKFSYNF